MPPERVLIIGGDNYDLRPLIRGFNQPTVFIADEVHHDMIHHDMIPYATQPWDVRDLNFHHKGETPRGTTPSWIGGTKKTKQQRKAIKARRKQ